nr:hypothetical protein [Tanacetum cinerariifolium]
MSSDSHATITYTVMSSYEVIVNGYFGMPIDPLDPYAQLVMEARPSPDYIPRPETPPSPDYISGSVYLEYLPSVDDVFLAEEQPLPTAVSPTTELPVYITDSEPEMDPEKEDGDDEKSKGDSIDYSTSRGDDDGDDLSEDDADDEDEEESSDSEEEEEEHLAPTVPAPALHSSISASEDSDQTEPFEEGETTATPPPSAYRVTARISVRPHIHMPFPSEASMVLMRSAAPSTFILAPLSRTPPIGTPPLLPIPLPTSSFPLPLLLPSTSCREGIPEADMPLQKKARFTTPTGGYEVGESSVAAAARQIRPALTVDDSRRADVRLIDRLRRERRYFRTLSTTYAQEVAHSRDYCTQIMDYCQSREVHTSTLVTQIEALQRDVSTLQGQQIDDGDRLTRHIQHEHAQMDAAPEDGDSSMSSDSYATITYTVMSSYEVIVNGYFGMPMDPLDPYAQLVMKAPPSPDYIPGPETPPSPDYIPGPVYLEYLPSADDVFLAEEQPLPAVVSSTTELPGYITDSEPEMDPKEEDGDDKKGGAPTVPAPALHSSIYASEDSDQTEPFEEGETAATPPPSAYRVTARISVRPHIHMPFPSKSEADMPLWKKARFTTPTSGYEVGESFVAAAARQIRHALTVDDSRRADVRLIDRLRRERRYFRTLSTIYAQEKMAPKRARTTRANPDPTRTTTATEPMTQEVINNLIAQRVTEALDEYETQRNSVVNGDTSHTTGTGPRTVRPTRECTYKDYLN